MKIIGGYFELELSKRKEYHQKALRLNTGRNAFEYILRAKKYSKIYLPYYICEVMLEPIKKLKIKYEFYKIDKTFRPIIDFDLINRDQSLIYVNYFGVCNQQISEISKKCKNLIIDNSQAFFSTSLNGSDTFYSPRKFFGVPDGAYLYTDSLLEIELQRDISFQRVSHLIGRIDYSPELYYEEFKKNDESLSNQPIKLMSTLTKRILQNIDYKKVKKKRRENFLFLHNALSNNNELKVNWDENFVPMVYPFLRQDGLKLKNKLIQEKVFVATYWNNVLSWTKTDTFENYLARNLVPLPIDQRYTIDEMKIIIDKIL